METFGESRVLNKELYDYIYLLVVPLLLKVNIFLN